MSLKIFDKNNCERYCYKYKIGLFFLGLIFFMGLFLRLYRLGQRSLWFDEADVVLDSISITGSLKILRLHNPGIFYKMIIFYWRHISPYIHEWLLRLPSVIFAMAALFLIYKLAVLFFNNRQAGIISSFLLSISPLHIYYSQEAVSYSFLVFLTISIAYCLIQLPKKNPIYFYLYTILNIIGIYTHFIMWLVFLLENAICIIELKKFRSVLKKIILCSLIIILLCVPCFYAVFSGTRFLLEQRNFHFGRVSGWIPQPTWESLLFTFKNFVTGYNTPHFLYPISIILFLVLFLKGTIRIIKEKNGIEILLFAFLPIVIIFAIAKITTFSYYVDRYFLPSLPFFCITVAYGICGLNKKSIQVAIITIIIVMSTVSLINYYQDILPGDTLEHIGVEAKKDIRGAAGYINKFFKEGDGIFHTCRNTALPFEYYFDFYFKKTANVFKDYPNRNDNKQNILLYLSSDGYFKKEFLILEGVDVRTYDNTVRPYKYMLRSEKLQSAYIELNNDIINSNRIWLIYSSWNFTGSNKPELYTVEWMDKNYIKEAERKFKGIMVYLYKKKTAY